MQYNTKEALVYLRALHPNVQISSDTFYHTLDRMKKKQQISKILVKSQKQIQYESLGKEYSGPKVYRYVFTKEQLDAMKFRGSHKDTPSFQPIKVNSLKELEYLRSCFGDLVDEQGLIIELYKRYETWYTKNAIRIRRMRGTLLAIATTGKTYWYPVEQLDIVDFSPAKTKNRKHETAMLATDSSYDEQVNRLKKWFDSRLDSNVAKLVR